MPKIAKAVTAHKRLRLPLLAAGMLALLAALWAGLLRLGWRLPPLAAPLAAAHGPLMIAGFLGTLISLERAVALGARWAYAVPLLTALGALIGLFVPGVAGPLLITLGSLGLLAIYLPIVRRQAEIFNVVMALGALAWFVGNLLWLAGWPIFGVVSWWAGFLVLTIAGERLELGRVQLHARGVNIAFVLLVGLLLAGLLISTLVRGLGVRLTSAGLLGLALWLLRYDIARRTVRRTGLTRFIAACMLSGYVWLAIGGVLAIVYGAIPAGPSYDAWLHALFLGFVCAMIFGHAPIIFPAVLQAPLGYSPRFYGPLIALHLSLALRVAGDLAERPAMRQWGGLLNAVVLVWFVGNTIWSILGRGPDAPRKAHIAG
jgi:hypothetical protein